MFVCGIQVVPSQSDPVSFRSRHHPGFGMVRLQRNGRTVISDVQSEPWWTLMHYENRARQNPNARWELQVDGPMSGYTLRRIRGQWYVTETKRGFA